MKLWQRLAGEGLSAVAVIRESAATEEMKQVTAISKGEGLPAL